ncbi:MAG: hypothetical protein MRY79_05255 [Alphaproteobacteria bacterium]|nr:hypothetical protein [Alphaproteobacteria bacterium]
MMELLAHDTGIWVAISFVLFLVVAFKLGRHSITGALDSRVEEVKSEIETAERLRVEAQELLAQYQRKQRDAEKESKDIIKKAKDQAKLIKKNAEIELEDVMARREVQLEERLRRAEEKAIADIQNHAAELAMSATKEMIVQTLDDKTNEKLNKESIAALSKNIAA